MIYVINMDKIKMNYIGTFEYMCYYLDIEKP